MSLLKVKVTSKSESKLYNYNKIVCTNINSKLLFIPLLIYYLWMMEERRIPIHKQIVQLHIYQTHWEVLCKIKSITTR